MRIPTPDRRSRLHARACSLAGAGSVVVHCLALPMHGQNVLMVAATLAMAAVCIPCVVSVWRHGTRDAISALMAMSLGMVLIHAAMLLVPGGMSHHGGHSGPAVFDPQADPGSINGALVLLAVMATELFTAMMAATWLRRANLHHATPEPPRGARILERNSTS